MSTFFSAHSPHLLNATSASASRPVESLSAIVIRLHRLLADSSDIEAIVPQVATLLGEVFQADGALVQMDEKHPTTEPTTYWYHRSDGNGFPAAARAAWEQDRGREENLAPFWLQDLDSGGSLLAVPAHCCGRTNGIVAVIRFAPPGWQEAEIEQLLAVAVQVGTLLDRVLQHRAMAALERQHRALTRLTRTIYASNDLDRILQEAIDGLGRALQVTRAAIVLLKYNEVQLTPPEGHKTVPKAKATVVSQWLGDDRDAPIADRYFEQSFWLNECTWFSQAFLAAPHPLVAGDRATVADISSPPGSLFRASWLSAFCICPLMSPSDDVREGMVLGFLVIQDSRPRCWKVEELEPIELAGLQVSKAILYTKTLQRARSTIVDRDTQLHRSLNVQAKLYEQSRRQVEQLQRLNRQKDEFLSTISHELKTPLTSMRMALKMLRESDLSGDRRHRYLNILERQCQQEIDLIDDLLALQQIESKQARVSVQTVEIEPLVERLAAQFDRAWGHKGMHLEVCCSRRSLKLQSDAEGLERILEELLTNAGKHAEPQTPARLQVEHRQNEGRGQIIFALTNAGPVIPPEDLPHLFDKFTRGRGVTQKAIAGTGLGLALVKGWVQLLQGTIDVSCHTIAGTQLGQISFTLTLPQTIDTDI